MMQTAVRSGRSHMPSKEWRILELRHAHFAGDASKNAVLRANDAIAAKMRLKVLDLALASLRRWTLITATPLGGLWVGSTALGCYAAWPTQNATMGMPSFVLGEIDKKRTTGAT